MLQFIVYLLLSVSPFKSDLFEQRAIEKRCVSAGAEGRWDNLYNRRRRQRRRVTEGGWNLHVFDGDWRHHLHKQWGGGWQHLLHDECVCEGCPHTTKWHFESSSRPGRVRTATRTNTSKHTCTHTERFHFTFSSPMSYKVGERKRWGGDAGSLCKRGDMPCLSINIQALKGET